MGETITNTIFYTPAEQKRIARIIFSLLLLSLVWSFLSNTLVHQLCAPVITYPYVDPTYWVMNWLRIPEIITGNYVVSSIFDGLLFGACALSLIFPGRKLFIWSFIILYFIYFITYNTYGAHHTGNKWGLLLIAVPFTAANNKSFNYLWQGLRYFLIFGYSCAFLWKFFRFGWLYPDQGLLILKKNAAAYLYFESHTLRAGVYHWLLQHPARVTTLSVTGMILEGLFIIGFFTRKFDRYLLILSVLLPFGFWLMADAYFFEMLILSLTLVKLPVGHFDFPLKKRIKGEVTPV